MEAERVVKLLKMIEVCPKCGNKVITRGKDKLEVTNNEFIYECHCGFKFTSKES